MELFLQDHFRDLMILAILLLVSGTLLILVPQLLRAHRQALELLHAERLRALEQGQNLSPPDDRSAAAGRTAVMVPMVVVCAAATVTCFLAVYRPDYLFAVALAVWSVAGVISLAAITGGVALMGRLAQLDEDEDDVEAPRHP